MRARGLLVGIASIVGSFAVYGAHFACFGGATPRPPAVVTAAAQTSTAVASASPSASAPASSDVPATSSCGCTPPKTTAWVLVSGDEKIALDPLDAQASLEVSYARGPSGKKQMVLSAVLRAFRTDVAAERPTTVAIRIVAPDGATQAAAKDVEAYLTTWGAGAVAPRAYATVAKSALSYTVTESMVEVRGSITLKDVAAARTVVLDKLSFRKVGTALLPERSGVLRAP